MKDIQNQHDSRRINIRKVGVKDVRYPVIVLDKAHRAQKTVATVNMYVNLPHQFKGTHMSRFVEILNGFHDRFTLSAYQRIMEEMKERLDAEAAHLEMSFPYFFRPGKSEDAQLARYTCRLYGTLATELDLVVEVEVPVSAVSCENAAPALWGFAAVAVRMQRLLWIEDLIDVIEGALADEGTSGGFPAVERACAVIGAALEGTDALTWYKVVVKNLANGYASFAAREWPDNRPPHGPMFATAIPTGPLQAQNL